MGMTRRDFIMLSQEIKNQLRYDNDLTAFAWRISERLAADNAAFDKLLFLKNCGVVK